MSFFGTGSSKTNKKKYENITLAIKQTVLEKSKYRCYKCSVKFSSGRDPNFEHINGSLKDNRPGNLRALCSKCFADVAEKEKKKGLLKSFLGKLGTRV